MVGPPLKAGAAETAQTHWAQRRKGDRSHHAAMGASRKWAAKSRNRLPWLVLGPQIGDRWANYRGANQAVRGGSYKGSIPRLRRLEQGFAARKNIAAIAISRAKNKN